MKKVLYFTAKIAQKADSERIFTLKSLHNFLRLVGLVGKFAEKVLHLWQI